MGMVPVKTSAKLFACSSGLFCHLSSDVEGACTLILSLGVSFFVELHQVSLDVSTVNLTELKGPRQVPGLKD